MRKWVALGLTAVIMLSSAGSWAEEPPAVPIKIQWMQAVGFMTGDERGNLNLLEKVTRAEAAALVMRAMGLEQACMNAPETAPYQDVASEHWAGGYIERAVKEGILEGYPDGTFRPENPVLYEELLKMLITALNYEAQVPQTAYPENYIQTARRLGLTNGIEAYPGQELNRMQAAELFGNAFDIAIYETDQTMRGLYLASTQTTGENDIGLGAAGEEADTPLAPAGSGGGSAASGGSGGGCGGYPMDYDHTPVYDSADNNDWIPEPGQLTAGRWDDHRNWDDWLLLMSDSELYDLCRKWGISTERYVFRILTEAGEPVWDAAVTLRDGAGEILWQSRTDREGTAYVFAAQAEDSQQENAFSVTVEGPEGQLLEEAVMLLEDAPMELRLPETAVPDGLDLMFVIDTTGSMGDELQYIKEELKDVVQKIDTPVRLSCNFYRDFSDVYTVRPFPFETNVDTVMSQISQQRAAGGGDYEEAVDLALIDAVEEHEWSESAKARLLFLVLDAPPHFNQDVIANLQAVTAAASQKGIRMIPVASSGVDKGTEILMRTLAIATNGTYLFLTDDSGIGNSHIDPTIGDYEVEYLNDLILSVIQEYIGQEA